MSDSEFTFVGQKVEKITLVFGLAMTIWGAVVTIISESQSLTSLIPSAIGLPMLIVGYLAIRYEHKKSFFMHIAVVMGLIMFVGGADLVRTLIGNGVIFKNLWADLIWKVETQKDVSAFEELFTHFAPRVKAFLMKSGADPQMAEECSQEVMATVWRKAHLFDPSRASASTWIFTIARNKKIDAIRKQNRPEPEQLFP